MLTPGLCLLSSGQEVEVGRDRLSAALHQLWAMARVRDFSGFCNPGGLCSLLQNHELPGSPRKRSRTKTINMLWTFYQLAPSQNKMRNELLVSVCVCVVSSWWERKALFFQMGIFSVDHRKVWSSDCVLRLASVVSDSLQPRERAACQAPLFMRILQASILEWVAIPSSWGSSLPRDQTQVKFL